MVADFLGSHFVPVSYEDCYEDIMEGDDASNDGREISLRQMEGEYLNLEQSNAELSDRSTTASGVAAQNVPAAHIHQQQQQFEMFSIPPASMLNNSIDNDVFSARIGGLVGENLTMPLDRLPATEELHIDASLNLVPASTPLSDSSTESISPAVSKRIGKKRGPYKKNKTMNYECMRCDTRESPVWR